ncbi:MAG: hypothetical protein K8R53_03770 [Bacteroidales bacterium]|nr:hypothetical protein [Bacteroidales bacterium]
MRRHRFSTNAPKVIGWVIGGIILAVIFAFIFGYFVMLLWNWLMPALFNLPEISYWMAFGIIILARLIFGGFGHKDHQHDEDCHHPRYFKSKFKEKFDPKLEKYSKWTHYDDFWNEEGKQAFENYVERKRGGQINQEE